MADVIWLDAAKHDTRALFGYIAERNPAAAERYVDGLEASFQRLADFPEIGRRYDARHRFIVYRNHLIFYQFDAEKALVMISAVVDGRRDIGQLVGPPG